MIKETGIYEAQTAESHVWSPKLAAAMTTIMDKTIQVIDVGCGIGYYVKHLINNGFYCIGLEGTENIEFLTNSIEVCDLTKPVKNVIPGTVISLEVGEHIPQKYEQVFLDNLCSICKDRMILSWAVPGQNGIGHVNCQDNFYIMSQMKNRGFMINFEFSSYLRKNIDDHTPWFRNTIMVFDRI